MLILTKPILKELRHNSTKAGIGFDPVPVLKLFNPCGAATWLVSEIAEDNDTMFGIADLGFGSPEIGYFSLREIMAVRLPFGLRMERDKSFKGAAPLSKYADEARAQGCLAQAIDSVNNG